MFCIREHEVEKILREYGVTAPVREITELQRYDFEWKGPDAKEVRLILKIDLENGTALVMRLKKEEDVTPELMEEQGVFAAALLKNGIDTPKQYTANGRFANVYEIDGYTVTAAVETFVENEVTEVDVSTAENMGALLAKMHNIAEREKLHVHGAVLFDPFTRNDLFDVVSVKALEPMLEGEEKALLDRILETYALCMEKLEPIRLAPRYAVQGDISDCNLYRAAPDVLGVFDFNRCGDNHLYCDAVMQAVFVSRLMVYPENREADFEQKILAAFWKGYHAVRAFSAEEQALYPVLYAVIDAFWREEDSALKAHERNDRAGVRHFLEKMLQRLTLSV